MNPPWTITSSEISRAQLSDPDVLCDCLFSVQLPPDHSETRPTNIAIDDYLRYPTEPECEFIDGTLFQKAAAMSPHASPHAWMAGVLHPLAHRLSASAFMSLSLRLREGAILIPDLCLLHSKELYSIKVPISPALLCVDVLSPSDTFAFIARKAQEYLQWGVPAYWILDPESEQAWVSDGNGLHVVPHGGRIGTGPFSVPLSEVFPA